MFGFLKNFCKWFSMWRNLLLSSAETVVSSKKSLSMQDGQGYLLLVLWRYLELEEDQHLVVQLFLPKSCKAKLAQHLYDVKPPTKGKKKSVRAKPVCTEKLAIEMLDAGVLQHCVRAKLVSTEKLAIEMLDAGVLQHCAKRALYAGMPQDCAKRADVGREMVAFRICAVAPVGFPDSLGNTHNVRVIASKMADLENCPLGSTLWSSGLSYLSEQESCRYSEEAQKEVVDKSYIPGLPDCVAIICLAYLPLSMHRSLALVSRRHRELVRDSWLLTQHRKFCKFADHWICIYRSGNDVWSAFLPNQNRWTNLPHANVNPNFNLSDKESLAAGTHLLWLGQEAFNFACYKYDLTSNSWETGPRMVNPRCLFGSATSGQYAFVAGGFSVGGMQPNVLNSAERYDSITGTWEPLPPMNTPRQKCSGFFMDGKFYVIGGKTGNHEQLTSGEEYDPVRNVWRTIENMYSAPQAMQLFEPSPPLVSVASNELYVIESSSNLLKVYEKGTNSWRILGLVPVRADHCNGWGLAFKALGDQLYVIGGHPEGVRRVAVFSCRPEPGASAQNWQLVNSEFTAGESFLYNCAVMTI